MLRRQSVAIRNNLHGPKGLESAISKSRIQGKAIEVDKIDETPSGNEGTRVSGSKSNNNLS